MQIAIAIALVLAGCGLLVWIVRDGVDWFESLFWGVFTIYLGASMLTLGGFYLAAAATTPAHQQGRIERFIEVKKMVEETEPSQSLMKLYFEAYHLNRELQKGKADLESWFNEPFTADGWADLEPIRIPAVNLPGSEVKEE